MRGPLRILAAQTLILFVATHMAAGTEDHCRRLLLEQNAVESNIKEFTHSAIGYLNLLVEKKIINESDIRRFFDSLNKGKIVNPIDQDEVETDSRLFIHSEGLKKKLFEHVLDLNELKAWAENTLKDELSKSLKREKVQENTNSAFRRIEFQGLKVGAFKRFDDLENLELTHPFEVMSTPLTQKQWVALFGENPSHFYNGKNNELQANHPVESITWWAALVAANKLSEAQGLKPVYDLSDIKWDPKTRVEDGSLKRVDGEVKINAPNGNIYLATGYRLPTSAEYEYLFYLENKENAHIWGVKRSWTPTNSMGKTHPVAELQPLIYDGQEIFDINGNVSIWVQDWAGPKIEVKDPVGPSQGVARVIRGESWRYSTLTAFPASRGRSSSEPNSRSATVGVRFVRTLSR